MKARDISNLRRRGMQVWADGDAYVVIDPDELTDGQVAIIAANKPSIIAYLRAEAAAVPPHGGITAAPPAPAAPKPPFHQAALRFLRGPLDTPAELDRLREAEIDLFARADELAEVSAEVQRIFPGTKLLGIKPSPVPAECESCHAQRRFLVADVDDPWLCRKCRNKS